MMTRRQFLGDGAVLALGTALPVAAGGRLPIRMAVEYSMLPQNLPIAERFALAKACGFEEIECPTTPDQATAEAMLAASRKVGLPIHSVMNMGHWRYPFTSSDRAEVERSLEGARTSIRNAHLWGASTVLLVPGVVNAEVSYGEAYTRSQAAIRRLLPLAEELKVTLAIEEVWNKFLLSPLEFARYIDEFETPLVQAYFDVGNVVLYGYPQDWIRTLGRRIVKLHIKDFVFARDKETGASTARWVDPGEGEIDWVAVYEALKEVGYAGTATVELKAGSEGYLREMRRRLGSILAGEGGGLAVRGG